MSDFSIHRVTWAGPRDEVISKIMSLEHCLSNQKRFLKLVGTAEVQLSVFPKDLQFLHKGKDVHLSTVTMLGISFPE